MIVKACLDTLKNHNAEPELLALTLWARLQAPIFVVMSLVNGITIKRRDMPGIWKIEVSQKVCLINRAALSEN